MPDRFLRDGYLRSSAINALPLETREFYVRLLLVADDFGCFDGREEMCATQCFPTKFTDADHIAQLLVQLHMAALIIRYSNAGKPYLAITQWGCDLRGSRKFPAPPLDVDLEGLKVRGKFGNPIGWSNPPGCDPVSVLLDFDGHASTTQPEEWRPEEHLRPATKKPSGWSRDARNTRRHQHEAAAPATSSVTQVDSGMQHVAVDLPHAVQSPVSRAVISLQSPDAGAVAGNGSGTPPATTSPAGNGIITLQNGNFEGLTEAQRLRWQEMFTWPIPDQIERSAAWLQANHGERAAIEKLGEGFESFIFRWLLREDRSHGT